MYEQKIIEGVKVVTCKIPHAYSVYIGIWIKAGSMYEHKAINGISHFIEHMVFKGSKLRSAKQIAEEMDSIGGQLNGFTEKESTCFYIKVLNTHVKQGLDILFDMVFNPAFKEEDIEKEKQVIFEEILTELDSPEDVAYNLLAKTIWKGHPLSFPVLGTFSTIKKLNKEQIVNYYNAHYNKDNIVISIAGNFGDDIYEILQKYLSKIQKTNVISQLTSPIWHKNKAFYEKDFEQVNLCIGLPGITYDLRKVYALAVINNAFGGGMSSRLFQKIREDKGLVYSIYSYPSTYHHAGVFSIFASMNANNFRKVYDLILQEMEEVHSKGLAKEEIDKFKEQLRINVLMDLDSISSRMSTIGKSMLLFNKVHTVEEILQTIDNLTYEEINDLAKKIINPDDMSIAVVGKLNKRDKGWLENVHNT
ncbi:MULTISPECIES: M16 family metallopeptidase [Thermoanaerobacter]|uniref:Peptidase M16 domain protein n=2 Tax=Thermoanaerobacter TaxID=1754 RepID=B0K9P2_THEP3|nr:MULTISPECIES: pitrilysin family protein [Thermoanaerobacter]ABY94855.1 peptidase M16 domain protein [Thermoanaerobacter pseudethanolicus ATCC 33223]ADV79804.1 processing peptidase [Thermoanaerobacter brockii subsp. finnii Ako-1]HBW59217.1 insulinase family protein [Thermoanaerobacter sp.]